MGIYDPGKGFDFSWNKAKYPIAIIVIVIAVVLVYSSVADMFRPQALYVEFEVNPLDLTQDGPRSTVISVFVTNILEGVAKDATVRVSAVDAKTIIVYPQERVISTLGTGETRQMDFDIRTNPSEKVYSGSYNLNVVFDIAGNSYEKEVTLIVKAA